MNSDMNAASASEADESTFDTTLNATGELKYASCRSYTLVVEAWNEINIGNGIKVEKSDR
jgi:hypothetical protein